LVKKMKIKIKDWKGLERLFNRDDHELFKIICVSFYDNKLESVEFEKDTNRRLKRFENGTK